MDKKEYNHYKEYVAKEVFFGYIEPFTIKEFKLYFKKEEEKLGIIVATDMVQNHFPKGTNMDLVPLRARYSGGWRFIDWDDRVRSFLKTKVKKGILSVERVDGKLYYKVRKEV